MIGISRKLQPVRLVRSRAKPLNSTPFNVNAYFKLKNSPVYNIKSFGDIKYSIRLLHDEKTTKQTEEEQVKVVLEDNEKNHTTEKIVKDTIEETPLIGKDLDIVHDYVCINHDVDNVLFIKSLVCSSPRTIRICGCTSSIPWFIHCTLFLAHAVSNL